MSKSPRDTPPSADESLSAPTDRDAVLRVGIVGCGDIFPYHRRGWSNATGVELTGFYDSDPAVVRQRTQEGGAGKAFENLDELIASTDIVDICTPPDSHVEIATAAIQGDCHLLIEKPVVLQLSDWMTLVSLADEREVEICALHNQKFFINNQRVRAWLEEKRIGNILRIYDEYMVTPHNEWMLGDEDHWSHKLPGGRWLETLPHNLYLLHSLVGPLELESVSTHGFSGSGSRTPAEVLISLRGDGHYATIHFSSGCDLDRRKMTIVGSRGVVEIVPPGRVATRSQIPASTLNKAFGLSFLDALSKLTQMISDRARFVKSRVRRDAHGLNILRFVEYLEGSGPNPTPRDEITYTVRLTQAIGQRMSEPQVPHVERADAPVSQKGDPA